MSAQGRHDTPFREVNILMEMNGWIGPFSPIAALIHMAQAQHLFCLVLVSGGIDTHGPEQITFEHITMEDHLALSHTQASPCLAYTYPLLRNAGRKAIF